MHKQKSIKQMFEARAHLEGGDKKVVFFANLVRYIISFSIIMSAVNVHHG